jgi:metallo-beta-lactamase class B
MTFPSPFVWRLAVLVPALIGCALTSAPASAQIPAEWSKPQKPFQIYGDTYYVGTQGLSSILIASKEGHVLIDGALPAAAPLIVANIRALGFRIEDVKLILNTHVHFDHAGGIAELQKLSGAVVAASPSSAKVLRSGAVDKDDPQFGSLPPIASIAAVQVVTEGQTQRVGAIAVTPAFTPGHTPGGTSWTWKSCEQENCLNVVYADSLNPISAKGYLYTDPVRNPNGAQQLEKSFAKLAAMPCDILLVPHPELADLFGKLAKLEQKATSKPFVDPNGCKQYVAASREKLAKRIADERAP